MNTLYQHGTLTTRENYVDEVEKLCSLTQSIGCGFQESMSK